MNNDVITPFPTLLQRLSAHRPDQVFLDDVDGRSLTFAEVWTEVERWHGALDATGVAAASYVGVMLPTGVDAVAVWAAVAAMRAVDVPIHNAYQGPILRHVLATSGASHVVIAAEFLSALLAELPELPGIQTVIVVGTPAAAGAAPAGCRIVSWSDLASEAGPLAFAPLDIAPWDTATILFTSGTTGVSKGAVIPWAQLHGTTLRYFPPLTDADVIYCPFPLVHLSGKFLVYLSALINGRAVLRQQFKTSEYWADIRKYGCTTTLLLGSMANFLLSEPRTEHDHDNPLYNVLMVPLVPRIDDFAERFGVRIRTTWGSTEVGNPVVSDWAPARPDLCGKVQPGFECRIVDEHDQELPDGEVGEIVVRSTSPWTITPGYLNMPEATLTAYRNLWFHTGDNGWRDPHGNFYFVDRRKDSIRRRGENISSVEVERQINLHPAISESAVIGVPTEWGEEDVKACLVLNPGDEFDPAAFWDFLGAQLPRFMVPRYVEVMDDLPRTMTLKVNKDILRADSLNARTRQRPDARG